MSRLQALSRDARSVLSLNRAREVAVLTRMLDLDQGHHLLDVGCGDGYWTRKLAKRAGSVTALDPDEELLRLARNLHRAPNIVYAQGAAEQLPFADAKFDRVIAISVLEHFDDPAQGLREMARVLRPGGWLAVSVDSLGPANSPEEFRAWHAERHHVTRSFTADELLDSMAESGLTPDREYVVGIHSSKLAGLLRRYYVRQVKWCFSLFPVFLGMCRLADLLALGGRMPAQILVTRAWKPEIEEGGVG